MKILEASWRLALLLWPVMSIAAENNPYVAAEAGTMFSIEQVVSEVLSNSPALKAARANWEAMKQRIPQARAWEDPRVGLNATAARFVDVPPNSFPDVTLQAEQTLPLSGRNRLRGEAASAEAVGAFAELRRRELDLTARARGAFFRLANAYAQLELNRKTEALLKQFTDISRSKYEAGKQTQADVLLAETDLAKIAEARFDIERQLAAEQTQLNVLMNRTALEPLGRPAVPQIGPPEGPLERLQGMALQHRPELLAAQKKIDAAKARWTAARHEWIPDPSFRVEASQYNESARAISEVILGFSLNVPWFNRRKYQSAIAETRSLQESAEHEMAALQNETLGMVRDQWKKIITFHHHSELFRDRLVPLAQQTVKANQLAYETDKGGLLELIVAQRTLQEVESMLQNHLTDYRMALAELESMLGADPKHAKNPPPR